MNPPLMTMLPPDRRMMNHQESAQKKEPLRDSYAAIPMSSPAPYDKADRTPIAMIMPAEYASVFRTEGDDSSLLMMCIFLCPDEVFLLTA